MEKLDLKKFEDYKLDKKQLSYIHAGECDTGSGMEMEFANGNAYSYRYDSDYTNSSGATFYNNYTLFNTVYLEGHAPLPDRL